MEAGVSEIRSAPLKPLDRVREKGRGSELRLGGHNSSNQTMSNFAQCFPQTNSVLPGANASTIGLGKGCRPTVQDSGPGDMGDPEVGSRRKYSSPSWPAHSSRSKIIG